MTPNELLDEVKALFQVVYVEPAKLAILLKQAIRAYQDKAGVVRTVQMSADAAEMARPADLLEVISVADAEGRWHQWEVSAESISVVESLLKSVKPYSVSYFADLSGIDPAAGALPDESIGLLRDYLEALIDIPNTNRARQIALATGVQTEFPSGEELRARKEAIELAMEEAQALLPMMTVY